MRAFVFIPAGLIAVAGVIVTALGAIVSEGTRRAAVEAHPGNRAST